jgi:lipoate-protein ligase A
MKMRCWRLLEYSSKNPAMNLAIEEAILRCLMEYGGPNSIRLWQNPSSVIIGYFQNPKSAVNMAACKKMKIRVIRRISGGGAVYHDHGNLNYSIFVERESLENPLKASIKDLEKSYAIFCGGVVEGLKALGIEAYSQNGDIMIRGKKVSGSAQHRLYNVILHHGTLMLNINMEMLGQALEISNPEKFLVNLHEVLPNKISLDKIKKAVTKSFEKTFNIKLEKGTLTSKERRVAKKLYKMKYSQENWNIKSYLYHGGFSL